MTTDEGTAPPSVNIHIEAEPVETETETLVLDEREPIGFSLRGPDATPDHVVWAALVRRNHQKVSELVEATGLDAGEVWKAVATDPGIWADRGADGRWIIRLVPS